MTSTQDKQLLKVDAATAKRIAAEGGALTLKQLAVVVNYSYETVRTLSRQPGFPLLAGKVTLPHYRLWAKRQVGLESAPDTSAHRPPSTSGKSGKSRG